jgi:predicted PurR-regulated permease PerM
MKQITSQISKYILKIATALIIVIASGYIFLPFFPPIIMGAVLALALSSSKAYLVKRGLTEFKALLALMLGIFFLALTPTLVFFIRGSRLINEYLHNPEFIEKLKSLQTQIVSRFNEYAPLIGLKPEELENHIQTVLTKAGGQFLSLFGSVIAEIPDIALFSIIMVIAIYVFLDNEIRIRRWFNRYFYFSAENADQFVQILKASSKTVFFSNVLTGVLQAVFVTVGALIFGVGDWFLVLFITFISSFIPVLGAGPVAFVLALYSFLTGDNVGGVGLVVIAVIAGAIDNVIRPFLVTSGEVEVPALISLLAVIGGVAAFGLKGLFLGPFITSLAFGVLPLIFEDQFANGTESVDSDM